MPRMGPAYAAKLTKEAVTNIEELSLVDKLLENEVINKDEANTKNNIHRNQN